MSTRNHWTAIEAGHDPACRARLPNAVPCTSSVFKIDFSRSHAVSFRWRLPVEGAAVVHIGVEDRSVTDRVQMMRDTSG
jgi:hypothetical protein